MWNLLFVITNHPMVRSTGIIYSSLNEVTAQGKVIH